MMRSSAGLATGIRWAQRSAKTATHSMYRKMKFYGRLNEVRFPPRD